MSWPTVINFSSGNWATWYYEIQASTTTTGRYNLYDSSGISIDSGNNDIEFTISGSIITLNVNPPTQGSETPTAFKIGTGTTVYTSNTVVIGDSITLFDGSSPQGIFTVPSLPTTSSGPTVTSITEDTIFVPSDTVSNTDFTLLKNGSAYANTNISLTGPGAQPPSDARGYTYSLTYNGTALYSRTIDSKSFHDLYYDDSWTSSPTSSRSTNSSRILAVLGTLPITANFTVPTVVGQTIGTRTFHDLNRSMRVLLTYPAGSTHTQFICYFHVSEINNEIKGKFQSHTLNVVVFDESPFFTIGAQQTMSHTFTINGSNITISVNDWVYSDEPEGDGYVAPVTTTSNGGGKPDRYPLIMTNLFNRNRSLYSIGMTHKDTWDLFL